jgi:DNA-binding SARP family transcriptional activator
MRVEITLLGEFGVRVDGTAVDPRSWERRHAASLVKLLALAPGRRLHREQCLDAIWPELGVDEAGPRLHKAAHYARKALGDRDAIVLRRDEVALFPNGDVTIDVIDFEALADRALHHDDPGPLAAALDCYGGPLLPADPYEPWADARREHARRLHVSLLRRAQRWDALLAEEPADEDAHVALMRAYIARGDRRAALRQYERMDRALRDELGMVPSEEATRLRDETLAVLPRAIEPASAFDGNLVGREHELEVLTDLLGAVDAGRGRAVLVSGPPGAGKSALVEQLGSRATALGWRCGIGGAAAIEGAWPYAPVLEAMADLGRRHPTLLDGLDDSYRSEIDRARRGDETAGAGESAEASRRPVGGRRFGHQRLFVAASELMRLAASGPGLLLVIDDAHDADDASLRLLHYLARTAAEARVLIAIVRRSNVDAPQLDEVRASLQQRDALTEVDVRPLDIDATRTLVTRLRPGSTEETVARIATISGGNPFAIIELSQRDGEEQGASPIGGIDGPTRDALQRVAIAGMQFDTDEFVALSGLPETDAFARLDTALAGRVVEWADAGYRFRHALVRDALLADLPPHRQRAIHRDAARQLAALGASDARVGFHLLRAGDPEAVAYLLRAAEGEATIGAYRDALALVESVGDRASTEQLVRIAALRGDLLFALGDPAAVAAYRDALNLMAPAGSSSEDRPDHERRLLRAKLGRAALYSGDVALAGTALRDLDLRDDAADSTIMLAQANYAYSTGDVATATELAAQARELVEFEREDWQLLDLIALQGLLAHNRGEWFEQLRHELRRTHDSPYLANAVFDGHLCVAEYLLYGPVPYSEVLALADSLRATATRAGALRAVAFAAALAGEAALLAGDLTRAEHELQEAVDLHREISASAGEAHSLQRMAELRVAQGRNAEARDLLQRALPLARWSSITLHLLQRIYGTMIRAASSPAEARAVVAIADTALGQDDYCTLCQVMYAVPAAIACADVRDLETAMSHYAVAEKSAQLWHGTAWQAATLEARAHLAAARDDPSAAADLLDRAALEFAGAGQPIDAARCRSGLRVASP